MFIYSLLSLTFVSVLGIGYSFYIILYQNHKDLSVTEAFIGIISQFIVACCVILWVVYGIYRIVSYFI